VRFDFTIIPSYLNQMANKFSKPDPADRIEGGLGTKSLYFISSDEFGIRPRRFDREFDRILISSNRLKLLLLAIKLGRDYITSHASQIAFLISRTTS
jgi:hypothetical protein